MFPDLTSDDIFRIETKRLWLRWPRASDAAAITGFAGLAEVAQRTALIPHPYPPGEAERFILKARADNASRMALILAIVQKARVQQPIGLVSAALVADSEIELGYLLAPAEWGQGFASEALKGLINTVFSLTPASRILASSRAENVASRRTLEKTGFAFVETGLAFLPARGGLHPCDRFELSRSTWAALRRVRGDRLVIPPMAQQRRNGASARLLALAAAQVEG